MIMLQKNESPARLDELPLDGKILTEVVKPSS